MFDPDPQRPALRLGEREAKTSDKPPLVWQKTFDQTYVWDGSDLRRVTTAERLALAERQMEEAIARWVEADMAWRAEDLQSRPISAVQDGAVRF